MPASPAEAIERFQRKCTHALEWRRPHAFNTLSAAEATQYFQVKDALAREMHQLACLIALMPKVEQAREALAALSEAVRQLNWLWTQHDRQDLAWVMAQAVCLRCEGQESGVEFHAFLKTVLTSENDKLQIDLARTPRCGIELHVLSYAPASAALLLDQLPIPVSSGLNSARDYWQTWRGLSDGERWRCLQNLKKRFQSSGCLSWLWLVATTHRVSADEQGALVSSTEWGSFAAEAVREFLYRLHHFWPHDLALPTLTLFGRIPSELLRSGFQALKADVREALLLRPLSFDQQGNCLQLPLLRDYCADIRVPETRRMGFRERCFQRFPQLRQHL